MPTYLYSCPIHGEFEREHSIKEELEFCPICEKEAQAPNEQAGEAYPPQKVKRLIPKGGSFILLGGGWSPDNYK
jgi:hypothetical protein